LLFNARWVLTPIYLGLAAVLLLIVFQFINEFAELALHIDTAKASDKIGDRRLAWTVGIRFLFLIFMRVVALSDRFGAPSRGREQAK
jgi:uncharacterized membrane protein YqhA